MMSHRIAILGPGALGCLFACRLRAGLGEDRIQLVLFDHRSDRAARRARQGLDYLPLGADKATHLRIPSTCDPTTPGKMDLILVCTKAHQTQSAIIGALPLIGPETLVWSIQNGLGNMEALALHVPARQILGGTTSEGAYWLDHDLLAHAGSGETWIGPLTPAGQNLEPIADLFSAADICLSRTEDIRLPIWNKLLISAGLNALTALAQVTNGQVATNPALRRAARLLLEEAAVVAAGQGIEIDAEQAFAKLLGVSQATAENRSSMRCDMEAGRKTEIDAINGAVARLGHAPANALVAELIRAAQSPNAVA